MTSMWLLIVLTLLTKLTFSLTCNHTLKCQRSSLEDGDIDCVTDNSCRFCSKINSTLRDIRCSSKNSCSNSKYIIANEYVRCEGSQACGYVTGKIESLTRSISCHSYRSCMSQSTAILQAYSGVYCYGYQSCYRTKEILVPTSVVLCGSTQSCYSVLRGITAKVISCYGILSCANSPITYAPDLFCMGERSCQGTEILNSTRIRAYGYRSLMSAVINATGNTTIYLYGYEAGEDLEIHCYETCFIDCSGNACSKTTIITHDNGQFILNCSTLEGIDCPIGYLEPSVTPTTNPVTSQINSPSVAPTYLPVIINVNKKSENKSFNLKGITWIIIIIVIVVFFIILLILLYFCMKKEINKLKNYKKQEQEDSQSGIRQEQEQENSQSGIRNAVPLSPEETETESTPLT